MRTALVLLFLLALAAVPGALLPQRSLNAQKVAAYIASRPTLGPILDRLQLFDVFASFWFTSVYALLAVSLVGCLVPRLVGLTKAAWAQPVPAPRNLSRLPHHHLACLGEPLSQVATRARRRLRGWRVATRSDSDGTITLSAEKGYLRDGGNLVFHFSLLGLLAAIAVGKVFGYEGSVIVIADDGPGFCNTSPAGYDSFRAGNRVDGTNLEPFCVRVENFSADYLPTGQAKMFTSDIAYQAGEDLERGEWRDYRLRVNDPLRVGGDRVYLTGHGYAPRFTVTFPDGRSRSEALQFRPEEATTFLSSGALRFDPPGDAYSSDEERRRNQIAVEGLFAPTARFDGTLLSSAFPAALDPAVAIDVYRGDTGLDSGRPQSIFSLDPELIRQGRLVKQTRANLRPGEDVALPDGARVRFDGAAEFVDLQVSHDPAQTWVLGFAVTMIVGLVVSLVIRRRRIWLRLRASHDPSSTEVEMGGLARTDRAGWGKEFTVLRDRIFATDTGHDRIPTLEGHLHADR